MSGITAYRPVRFALIGTGVAGFYVALYLLFLSAGLDRFWSNGLAFAAAVLAQYLGQTLFTFRRRLATARQIYRFSVMICLGLATSALITGSLAPALRQPEIVAAVAVALILPVQNYFLMKAWVYVSPAAVTEL